MCKVKGNDPLYVTFCFRSISLWSTNANRFNRTPADRDGNTTKLTTEIEWEDKNSMLIVAKRASSGFLKATMGRTLMYGRSSIHMWTQSVLYTLFVVLEIKHCSKQFLLLPYLLLVLLRDYYDCSCIWSVWLFLEDLWSIGLWSKRSNLVRSSQYKPRFISVSYLLRFLICLLSAFSPTYPYL